MDNIVIGIKDASYPTGMTERGKYLCSKYVNDLERQLTIPWLQNQDSAVDIMTG
jgi:hypothetical protein